MNSSNPERPSYPPAGGPEMPGTGTDADRRTTIGIPPQSTPTTPLIIERPERPQIERRTCQNQNHL